MISKDTEASTVRWDIDLLDLCVTVEHLWKECVSCPDSRISLPRMVMRRWRTSCPHTLSLQWWTMVQSVEQPSWTSWPWLWTLCPFLISKTFTHLHSLSSHIHSQPPLNTATPSFSSFNLQPKLSALFSTSSILTSQSNTSVKDSQILLSKTVKCFCQRQLTRQLGGPTWSPPLTPTDSLRFSNSRAMSFNWNRKKGTLVGYESQEEGNVSRSWITSLPYRFKVDVQEQFL